MSRLPLPSGQHDAAEHMCSIHAIDLKDTEGHIACWSFTESLTWQWGNTPSPLYDPFYRWHTELSCQDGCVLWGQQVVYSTN